MITRKREKLLFECMKETKKRKKKEKKHTKKTPHPNKQTNKKVKGKLGKLTIDSNTRLRKTCTVVSSIQQLYILGI